MQPFSRVRKAFRRRYREWVNRRTRAERECRLNHRRLYIFPTRPGFGFLLLVASLWLLATNFENNLVFMLCFLLLALFVVSIHFTHATLSGLSIRPVSAESVFKGDAAAVELCLSQSRPRRREQLFLRYGEGDPVWVSIAKSGDTFVTVLAPTTRRGRLDAGLLTVESVYPVGLMRVWTHLRFHLDAVVYPAPVADPAPTTRSGPGGEGHFTGATGSEDYAGLKTFEPGESLRHVAWKQYAREQGLWSKQYGDPVDSEEWVDWDDYAGIDGEERLSRMCWRVCECEVDGVIYGLRLPGSELAPGRGVSHRRTALRRLALHGEPGFSGDGDEAA
jgi:uncharacterized protein (DUF58 family)